jgi:hypothetical protein
MISVNQVSLYGPTGQQSVYLDNKNNLHLGETATGTYYSDAVDDLVATIIPTSTDITSEINGTGVYAYKFPSTPAKTLSFTCQLSHMWDAGTRVVPHFHCVGSTAETTNATFTLTYWVRSYGNATPSSPITPATTSTITANIVMNGTAWTHQICGFGAVDMTGNTESCIFGGTLTRSTTDAYAGDIFVLSVDLHHQKNKLGLFLGYPDFP